MSTTSEKQWRNVEKEVINPFFKMLNFNKSGRKYIKQLGHVWHVCTIQILDKYDLGMSVALNFAICHDEAYQYIYNEELPQFPDYCCNMIFGRMDMLAIIVSKGQDEFEQAYFLDTKTDEIALKETVRVHLNQYAIPFYEAFSTEEDIVANFFTWAPRYNSQIFFLYKKLRPLVELQNLMKHYYDIEGRDLTTKEIRQALIIEDAERLGVVLDISNNCQ